jgi:hypothetical protein
MATPTRSDSIYGNWANLPGTQDNETDVSLTAELLNRIADITEDAPVATPAAPAPTTAPRSLAAIDAELDPIKAQVKALQAIQSPLLRERAAAVAAPTTSPRSLADIDAELDPVKAQIKAIQAIQSPLLRERSAAIAASSASAAPASSADAPPTVPFVFNLVVPVVPAAQPRTMLCIIGPRGERHPTQKGWIAEWQRALKVVQALPREQYSPAFAQIKKQFEDQGCIFEKRPIVPPARGANGASA